MKKLNKSLETRMHYFTRHPWVNNKK